jgi:hypothetical protein
MSLRIRKDGTIWCAAHTQPEPDDTYIDDGLHYEMSVVHGVIVALPMPEHVANPQWWWTGSAPAECSFINVRVQP